MNSINGINFDIAYRWWGTNLKNEPMELDIVAESIDKKYILIGESKWSKITDTKPVLKNIEQKASLFPFAKGKQVVVVLYVKETTGNRIPYNVFLPLDVLNRLK
jgi:hypothetical protein